MIRLEPFQKSDYFRLISWADTAETLFQFAGPAFSFPLTAEQLDESCSDQNRKCFKVLLATTEQVIGHAEIYLKAEIGWLGRILIGDASFRGQGLGQQLVEELLIMCFGRFCCEEVRLNVFDRNAVAISCYLRCGFSVNPAGAFERRFCEQVWAGKQMTLSKEGWRKQRSVN